MTQSFWLRFVQHERRLHIRATIEEMHALSSTLYAGVSICGIIAINLPIWPGINSGAIYTICGLALLLALVFYQARNRIPLWFSVLHMPLGILMLTLVIYFSHAEQSLGIAAVYVLGSTYIFHYFTRTTALLVVTLAMLSFGFAMYLNQIVGWQAMVFFIGGCCLLMGKMVRMTVSHLNFLAVRDTLTGLLNRRTIDALATEALDEAKKKGKLFTFMLLDLNQFKQINDTHGHLHGDKVLKQFSAALKDNISPKDYAARWGGDEFLVILDDADKTAAQAFSQSLNQTVKDIIGFEMGVSYPEKNDTLDSLMRRADENMYLMKRHRRSTDETDD